MNQFKQFSINCTSCGSITSKAYARKNGGKCKACATGMVPKSQLRPGQHFADDGGEYKMSYEYACEVRGMNDASPDC